MKTSILIILLIAGIPVLNLESMENLEDQKLLIKALKINKLDDVQKAHRLGASIVTPDYLGATPLHVAVNWQAVESTAWLLNQGALVNVADRYGYMPLHHAVFRRNPALIEALIQAGAHFGLQGENPLSLFRHIRKQDDRVVIGCLLQYGFDIRRLSIEDLAVLFEEPLLRALWGRDEKQALHLLACPEMPYDTFQTAFLLAIVLDLVCVAQELLGRLDHQTLEKGLITSASQGAVCLLNAICLMAEQKMERQELSKTVAEAIYWSSIKQRAEVVALLLTFAFDFELGMDFGALIERVEASIKHSDSSTKSAMKQAVRQLLVAQKVSLIATNSRIMHDNPQFPKEGLSGYFLQQVPLELIMVILRFLLSSSHAAYSK